MLKLESAILSATDYFRVNIYIYVFDIKINIFRECVSTGAAGAQTRRSLGHHLSHPLILVLRVPFYRTDCTRRS